MGDAVDKHDIVQLVCLLDDGSCDVLRQILTEHIRIRGLGQNKKQIIHFVDDLFQGLFILVGSGEAFLPRDLDVEPRSQLTVLLRGDQEDGLSVGGQGEGEDARLICCVLW